MTKIRTFKYQTWGGATRVVEATSVEFGASHVIFYDGTRGSVGRQFIVKAESATNVNALEEIENGDE